MNRQRFSQSANHQKALAICSAPPCSTAVLKYGPAQYVIESAPLRRSENASVRLWRIDNGGHRSTVSAKKTRARDSGADDDP